MTTATADGGLVVQGTGGGLREVLERRHLLAMLVRKELRVRYRASVLGLGWSYVKPAVQFAVYFVGIGLVLRQSAIGDYAIYLFGGLVVVTTLSEAVGNATRSVVVNGELLRKIFLPRDLENVVDLVLTVLVWTSPVLYPWQVVGDLLGSDSWLFRLYQLNPVTVAVELVHRGTWATASAGNLAQAAPDLLPRTVFAFAVTGALVLLGQRVFRRMSGSFAQEL